MGRLVVNLLPEPRLERIGDAVLILPGAQHTPFLALDHPVTERVITFTSASKGWNIPGLKCGVAIAGSPATAAVLVQRWDALFAAEPGILATVAAFTNGHAWLDAMLAHDRKAARRQQVSRAADPGLNEK